MCVSVWFERMAKSGIYEEEEDRKQVRYNLEKVWRGVSGGAGRGTQGGHEERRSCPLIDMHLQLLKLLSTDEVKKRG